ncbi:MAG: hypothetical protein K6T63_09885 [Alicyclobacillus herbarius]|uniref:hypothetical protein n=1 Tax=Alicyclobacillus herbarius TaxID=122960 RepID=UPI00047897CD|nr:hypothetical protein [Alicyclobacillus herbarius]MCL6632932.1 hypothetical protein [Alicyclobacillus herbarius]
MKSFRKLRYVTVLFAFILPVTWLTLPGLAYETSTAVADAATQTMQGPFYLDANEVECDNAQLHNPLSSTPELTCTEISITGMTLTYPFTSGHKMVMQSPGPVTGSDVKIDSPLLTDVTVGLENFTNKADLLVLAAGGTVKHLELKNVHNMKINRMEASHLNIPNLTMKMD